MLWNQCSAQRPQQIVVEFVGVIWDRFGLFRLSAYGTAVGTSEFIRQLGYRRWLYRRHTIAVRINTSFNSTNTIAPPFVEPPYILLVQDGE